MEVVTKSFQESVLETKLLPPEGGRKARVFLPESDNKIYGQKQILIFLKSFSQFFRILFENHSSEI
jgi:hypothetical protein